MPAAMMSALTANCRTTDFPPPPCPPTMLVALERDGLSADALDATQTINVQLTVTPAPVLTTDASDLYQLSARLGHPIAPTTFHIWNSAIAPRGVMLYSIATNAGWLSVSPVSGSSAGETDEIIFSCNPDNLRPGKYEGALTISASDQDTGTEAYDSPVTIIVEMTIIGSTVFDFAGEGSGSSDLVVYKESSGLWSIKNLATGYTTNSSFGGYGYVPVPGDYDGDGITDLGVYRYASGYWYLRRLTDSTLAVLGGSFWAGPKLASSGGMVSVAGDFDGDGKTDPAMYCEQTALWSLLYSASGYTYASGTFGGPGYVAAREDYDGDGLIDPAVYAESTAQWYVLYSSENYGVITSYLLGGPGFEPVPADYDGDSLADYAVYNESSGEWVILPSTSLTSRGYVPVSGVFGGPGFIPVPSDYNGDGMADACVYDTATGNWFIVDISGAHIAWPVQHGGYGFTPVKP